jgi:hypothetical protein
VAEAGAPERAAIGGEDFRPVSFYEGIFSNNENRSIPEISWVQNPAGFEWFLDSAGVCFPSLKIRNI